jgi:NADH:ubiquinone oxidoreductase subunit 2 (subunit N)
MSNFFTKIVDRLGIFFSLIGFVASLMILFEAKDALHVFWGLTCLSLSTFALWANLDH